MKADLEIAGARIVTEDGIQDGCIAVTGGRISGLYAQPSGAARQTIDATGLHALPGMVDQHVHFMDPGETAREDFIHGSRAAAAGGVTTVVEHTHSHPVLDVATYADKVAHLAARSVVDFGLTAHVFPHTVEHVVDLWQAGVLMLKAFTCATHGVPALLSDDLLRLFTALKTCDGRVLVHCEDEWITEDNEERLKQEQRADNAVILEWRSPEAEMVAVNTVALLARLSGARVTIAHASQPSVIALAQRERALGARLTVESCPQYFYLNADDVRAHGALRKFTPPARETLAAAGMWEFLADHAITLISSDHAPSTTAQKLSGTIWECPFGLPGVQTTLTLLLSAVNDGKLSLERLVQVYSATPARLLGLFPRKGSLRLGADADIVLVDLAREHVLRDEDMLSLAGWTPYAGQHVKGYPVRTFVRGVQVAENGQITAHPGHGRLVERHT